MKEEKKKSHVVRGAVFRVRSNSRMRHMHIHSATGGAVAANMTYGVCSFFFLHRSSRLARDAKMLTVPGVRTPQVNNFNLVAIILTYNRVWCVLKNVVVVVAGCLFVFRRLAIYIYIHIHTYCKPFCRHSDWNSLGANSQRG